MKAWPELSLPGTPFWFLRHGQTDYNAQGLSQGAIDIPAIARLKAACGAAPVTFHKAFDRVRDLGASLDVLADLGIGRILTSGGPDQVGTTSSGGSGRRWRPT